MRLLFVQPLIKHLPKPGTHYLSKGPFPYWTVLIVKEYSQGHGLQSQTDLVGIQTASLSVCRRAIYPKPQFSLIKIEIVSIHWKREGE